MDKTKFSDELKAFIMQSDFMERYFSEQSRKYHRIDYWIKTGLGLAGLFGTALLGNSHFSGIGGILAGITSFLLGIVLPKINWDKIVSGFADEQEAWTRIHHGYEDLLRNSEISDIGEILLQEFQRIREMHKTAALDERYLCRSTRVGQSR